MKTLTALDLSVEDSIGYLSSDEALKSMIHDPYWPKWNSPWWHFSVLHEMGLASRIPKKAAEKMLESVRRTNLPYFFKHETPEGIREDQDAPCPCGLGNIYQILTATGLAVDAELPWARAWFLKYQASDGGLSCDEEAYQEANASSIVGTIACLEALLAAPGPHTSDELSFLDRGAQFLLQRELRIGSSSKQNAEERDDETEWMKLCFPRFYLYDVLRGLSFVLNWAKFRSHALPYPAIKVVYESIQSHCSGGQILIARQSFDEIETRAGGIGQSSKIRSPASHFPLLDEVSRIGESSIYLTRMWENAQALLAHLKESKLLTD